MQVKICGLCAPEDAALADAAGADYIGVILAPGYERTRSTDEARTLFEAAPNAQHVGVFVDADVDTVVDDARRLRLDVLQLHGAETPETVEELRRAGEWSVWKAIRPRGREEFLNGIAAYAGIADGILVDGWSQIAAGGTGIRFPWAEIAAVRDHVPHDTPLIAAGGLEPSNVREAIECLRPDAVDVSSGVERSTGHKSDVRVRSFITNAHDAARRALSARDPRRAVPDLLPPT